MYHFLFSSSLFFLVSSCNKDQSKSSDSDASEESRNKNTRTGRSNRGHSNTRTGTGTRTSTRTGTRTSTRTGTRTSTRRTGPPRGIPAVEETTASMIADLQKKKQESDKQATFANELSSMDAVLKKAKEKLEEGGALTIPFLKALIKSKGVDPPDGKKAALKVAWSKVKDSADWKRKDFFTEQDKTALELLENDNSEDEE